MAGKLLPYLISGSLHSNSLVPRKNLVTMLWVFDKLAWLLIYFTWVSQNHVGVFTPTVEYNYLPLKYFSVHTRNKIATFG